MKTTPEGKLRGIIQTAIERTIFYCADHEELEDEDFMKSHIESFVDQAITQIRQTGWVHKEELFKGGK